MISFAHVPLTVTLLAEFCRNVIGWEGANTTEIDPDCKHKVIIDMPEISKEQMGGTMRLGKRTTIFVKDKCLGRKLDLTHFPFRFQSS